jgi:hypothetical protein
MFWYRSVCLYVQRVHAACKSAHCLRGFGDPHEMLTATGNDIYISCSVGMENLSNSNIGK